MPPTDPKKKLYQQSEKGRQAARDYTAKRRRELWDKIAALKEAGSCFDCNGQFPAVAMDYDHVTGEKIAGVTQLAARRAPWSRIQDEIDKCELVCANCHRVRSHKRKQHYPEWFLNDKANASSLQIAGPDDTHVPADRPTET